MHNSSFPFVPQRKPVAGPYIKNSLDKEIFIDPGQIIDSEIKPAPPRLKPTSIPKEASASK